MPPLYSQEAFRCLKAGGELMIAEVKSRFENNSVASFVAAVEAVGFAKVTLLPIRQTPLFCQS
jgi:hypothetical protein